MDTLMPVFYDKPSSLIDYLPPGTAIFIDDEIEINESAQKLKQRLEAAYGSAKHIEKIVEPKKLYDEWASNIGSRLQKITSVQGLSGDIKIAINQIKRWRETGFKIISTAHTSTQAERMHDIFRWHEIISEITDRPFADALNLGRSIVWIMPGDLSKGFVAEKDGLVVLTDTDIFGSKVSRRSIVTSPAETFTDFSQINEKDCIIHKEHGIGRYLGLKNMEIGGVKNDFLILEYLGGDKLYLPVWKINLISRYLGADSGKTALDRLGSRRWAGTKAKVTASIRTMAMELLKIYAARKVKEGFAFGARDEQFEEFEAAFPYDETPDQWKAIEETLKEMQEGASMDRLICGDVGYGKTEVAMRAAFRAVADGKQVAILVPTTVLAFQHYENFMSRFSKWPVRIEMLSRFRSRSEQKHIIGDLALGTVNIVIGTHRLLQRDIKFQDIGLLIVDEEHRFGVAHKEKIRKLAATVDTITMSATPIPRTLHLSLSGIRNISIINTPPANRLAIRTYVSEFDEEVIRGAIMAELSRGGQVFFVHNRVESIDKMQTMLTKLVPEAKIVVGHGQMGEHELEDVMINFLEKKANVLLCTTIIESGIDIPTANTIIISRADTFGLAQLYQLRGRVGRSTVQAYAYLLIPSEEAINPTAQKRLALLQRYTELGSGFQIAMHDLEIRGAGNILGAQQSGHINAIGYEMYIDLLERAIRHLQGKPETLEIDAEINLPVEAFIPTDYVGDEGQRLVLYRRLAAIGSPDALDSLAAEIADRYGKLPDTLKNLLTIVEIKLTAKKLSVESIQYDGRIFSFKFHPKTPVKPELILTLVKNDPKKFAFKQPNMLFVKDTAKSAAAILNASKAILHWLNP
ncbi:MAG: transcription-repair coupling factor [Deltaproteobacteria bacterium]|nr:transcription-repair coupling factor [Deltaproteobacteria bacterium]